MRKLINIYIHYNINAKVIMPGASLVQKNAVNPAYFQLW